MGKCLISFVRLTRFEDWKASLYVLCLRFDQFFRSTQRKVKGSISVFTRRSAYHHHISKNLPNTRGCECECECECEWPPAPESTLQSSSGNAKPCSPKFYVFSFFVFYILNHHRVVVQTDFPAFETPLLVRWWVRPATQHLK